MDDHGRSKHVHEPGGLDEPWCREPHSDEAKRERDADTDPAAAFVERVVHSMTDDQHQQANERDRAREAPHLGTSLPLPIRLHTLLLR